MIFGVMLDVPDTKAASAFYAELTGKPVGYEAEGMAMIGNEGEQPSLFRPALIVPPPRWPDPCRRADSTSTSRLTTSRRPSPRCWRIGATRLPGEGEDWRVFADPHGKPFCLIWDNYIGHGSGDLQGGVHRCGRSGGDGDGVTLGQPRLAMTTRGSTTVTRCCAEPGPARRSGINTVAEPKSVWHRVHLDLRQLHSNRSPTWSRCPRLGEFAWTTFRDPEGGELLRLPIHDEPIEHRLKDVVVQAIDPTAISRWSAQMSW